MKLSDSKNFDLEKFDTKLYTPKKTKEQVLFDRVLAAAIAADRQGLFCETQTLLDQDATLTKKDIEIVWGSSKLQRALDDRGIKTTQNPNLTLRQEMFLQAYLSPMNLKTPQVIAKQMKIGIPELDGWLRQKEFASAMSTKSAENLKTYIPIADKALGDLVQQGDMKAITFLNQLTGRFDPNARANLDVPALLMQVQDIILRHVLDPAVKRNIARELIALASGQSHFAALPEPTRANVESETDIIIIDD
jgi:hypothetical protein